MTHLGSSPGGRRQLWCLIIAVLLLAGAARTSTATTVVQFGTAQLTRECDTIVRATATATESRRHPEHNFIYTYVTLRVEEILKGNPALAGSQITLEELGGQVDGVIHLVPGIPQFEPGEEVLSFLENRPENLYRTFGMVQGKFRFESEPRSGMRILTRPAGLNDARLSAVVHATDLTPARPDGSYEAEPLLQAIRDWVAGR